MLADGVELLQARGLKIAHLNVASMLGAHKFEMMRIQVENSKLDVFCASETWLNTNVPDELVKIKGFNLTRLDRGWREGGETRVSHTHPSGSCGTPWYHQLVFLVVPHPHLVFL